MFDGRNGVTKTSWTLNKTLQKRVHVGFLFSLMYVLKMKFKGSGRFQNVTLLGWRSRLKHVLPGNVIVTFRWRRMVHWDVVNVGQCQPRIIIWTNVVGLTPPMLYTNPKVIHLLILRRSLLKVLFTIYWHSGHLGLVTETILIYFS